MIQFVIGLVSDKLCVMDDWTVSYNAGVKSLMISDMILGSLD